MPSRLESLPTELFNQIMSYVLDHTETQREGDSSRPRHYEFETAVLRLNKATHKICKAQLDNGNPWIVFTISALHLPFVPGDIGIPVWEFLDSDQEYPAPVVEVELDFPEFNQLFEVEILNDEILPDKNNFQLMVLAADLPEFLQCLRLNEWTHRYTIIDVYVDHGLLLPPDNPRPVASILCTFTVRQGVPSEIWRPILSQVRNLDGSVPHVVTAIIDNHVEAFESRIAPTMSQDANLYFSHQVDLVLWLLQVAHEHVSKGRYALGVNAYQYLGTLTERAAGVDLDLNDLDPQIILWIGFLLEATCATIKANRALACIKGNIPFPPCLRGFPGQGNNVCDSYVGLIRHLRQYRSTAANQALYDIPLQTATVIACAGLILDPRAREGGGVNLAMANLPCPQIPENQRIPLLQKALAIKDRWYDAEEAQSDVPLDEIGRIYREQLMTDFCDLVEEMKPWRWVICEAEFPCPEVAEVMRRRLEKMGSDSDTQYDLAPFPPGATVAGHRYLL